MMIFAQLIDYVILIKVTAILMMNAKIISFVDQTIVHFQIIKNALVLVENLTIKVTTIVMMITTIVDVNGMEGTVVIAMYSQVAMYSQIIVQLVNVYNQALGLMQLQLTAVNQKVINHHSL